MLLSPLEAQAPLAQPYVRRCVYSFIIRTTVYNGFGHGPDGVRRRDTIFKYQFSADAAHMSLYIMEGCGAFVTQSTAHRTRKNSHAYA